MMTPGTGRLDGNASSEKALQYGHMARQRSERAWLLLQERGLVA